MEKLNQTLLILLILIVSIGCEMTITITGDDETVSSIGRRLKEPQKEEVSNHYMSYAWFALITFALWKFLSMMESMVVTFNTNCVALTGAFVTSVTTLTGAIVGTCNAVTGAVNGVANAYKRHLMLTLLKDCFLGVVSLFVARVGGIYASPLVRQGKNDPKHTPLKLASAFIAVLALGIFIIKGVVPQTLKDASWAFFNFDKNFQSIVDLYYSFKESLTKRHKLDCTCERCVGLLNKFANHDMYHFPRTVITEKDANDIISKHDEVIVDVEYNFIVCPICDGRLDSNQYCTSCKMDSDQLVHALRCRTPNFRVEGYCAACECEWTELCPDMCTNADKGIDRAKVHIICNDKKTAINIMSSLSKRLPYIFLIAPNCNEKDGIVKICFPKRVPSKFVTFAQYIVCPEDIKVYHGLDYAFTVTGCVGSTQFKVTNPTLKKWYTRKDTVIDRNNTKCSFTDEDYCVTHATYDCSKLVMSKGKEVIDDEGSSSSVPTLVKTANEEAAGVGDFDVGTIAKVEVVNTNNGKEAKKVVLKKSMQRCMKSSDDVSIVRTVVNTSNEDIPIAAVATIEEKPRRTSNDWAESPDVEDVAFVKQGILIKDSFVDNAILKVADVIDVPTHPVVIDGTAITVLKRTTTLENHRIGFANFLRNNVYYLSSVVEVIGMLCLIAASTTLARSAHKKYSSKVFDSSIFNGDKTNVKLVKESKRLLHTASSTYNIYNYDANASFKIDNKFVTLGSQDFSDWLDKNMINGISRLTITRSDGVKVGVSKIELHKQSKCTKCGKNHLSGVCKEKVTNFMSTVWTMNKDQPMELRKQSLLGKKSRLDTITIANRLFKVFVDGNFVCNAFLYANKLITTKHAIPSKCRLTVKGVTTMELNPEKMVSLKGHDDLCYFKIQGQGNATRVNLKVIDKVSEILLFAFDDGHKMMPATSFGIVGVDGYHTAASKSGNCGGVLVNEDGEILGFHEAGSTMINKCIPITQEIFDELRSDF